MEMDVESIHLGAELDAAPFPAGSTKNSARFYSYGPNISFDRKEDKFERAPTYD
jgi:hypothetical protein